MIAATPRVAAITPAPSLVEDVVAWRRSDPLRHEETWTGGWTARNQRGGQNAARGLDGWSKLQPGARARACNFARSARLGVWRPQNPELKMFVDRSQHSRPRLPHWHDCLARRRGHSSGKRTRTVMPGRRSGGDQSRSTVTGYCSSPSSVSSGRNATVLTLPWSSRPSTASIEIVTA